MFLPSTYYSIKYMLTPLTLLLILPLVRSEDAIRFVNRPATFEAIVPVKAPPGHHVFKLQARTNEQHNHNIHYSLVRDRTGGKFEVDERTGDVRTKGTESYQLDKEYVIFVKAEDYSKPIGDRLYPSTQEHRLSIMGGRRPPQFLLDKYSQTIPENHEKDQEVTRVQAQSFKGEPIQYSLQSKGKGTGTFVIEQTTGIVRLAKELDYEDVRQPRAYNLKVNATEEAGGFTSSVDLHITITDVNDNAPKFERPDYQIYNILEDVKPGYSIARIIANDADSGRNAEIEYEIDRSEFVIDKTGHITTNRRLDADVNNTYILTVKAKDKGNPSLSSSATVRIYTENTNDEAPKFSQDVYTPNVDENAGPKTLVTTVVASDKDGDNIIFGFAPGSRNPMFQIDERTGVIRLSSNGQILLDKDKYELNVTAKDDGKCCDKGTNVVHTSSALVVVFITDVNDNKPIFSECETYNPTIQEGSPSGTSVITVKATDQDKGHNGMVRYSIVQQPNQKGTKFTIDELNGDVRSNKVFDREGEDGRFVSITVKAVDRGNPPMEGVCSFKVEIIDVNDNPPLFDRQEYSENVDQDQQIGSQILRVSASDEDADTNGLITYSLQGRASSTFSINPDSGWITLKKQLTEKTYHMEAIATDRGLQPNRAQVAIKISVIDMGINPPSWDRSFYEVKVKENVNIGTNIITIKAQSGIPDNPTVYYTLLKGGTEVTNKKGTFFLNPKKEGSTYFAEITTSKHLDYESVTSYNLTIRVENDGAHQLASECIVHVTVIDVNDEIPWFTEQEQHSVLEGMPAGTKVTTLRAVDSDGTFPNNQVLYMLEKPKQEPWDKSRREKGMPEVFDLTELFDIDQKSGDLFTKREFDREERQSYNLPVIAYDGAPSDINSESRKPNSVTHYIRISIGDKNDNAPYFDRSLYEAEVNEDEDINHNVITVTAKDKDESSRLRYEITKGNVGGGAFAVNNETGAIYVAGPLDYELRKEYDLTLGASDGLHDGNTTVRIRIKDVNDLPPKFANQTYVTTIQEQNRTPLLLLQVVATDGDRDREQNIVYFLGTDQEPKSPSEKDKDKPKYFSINSSTGEIFVEKPLDRDAPLGRPQWRFTVYAEDEGGKNGLVGYADVLVNLKDINDNAPFFQNAVYYGNVTENSTNLQTVMTMSAIDYDDPTEGTNAKLRYAIEQNQVNENGDLIFKIDEDTGVIQTAVCCLDRESNPEYNIKVTATDGGNMVGSVQAIIKVKDVNDMPPSFAKKEFNVEVDETDGDVLLTQPILVVTVNDGDLLETNRFTYKILERDNGHDKFTMVTNTDGTGSLKVAKPLDFEDPNQRYGFNLTIEVNDHGGEPGDNHVDQAIVRIKLKDINDNKPIFDQPAIEVSVAESAPVGTLLANFTARDPDQVGLSRVSYAIDRSSDREKHFHIDPLKGSVKIQRMLDRESVSRHNVKVFAIDDGVPSKTATASLTVIVTDINDNAPRLSKDDRMVIRETLPPGQRLEGIMASDPDDRSVGNGPPFLYMLDPAAPDIIKSSFEVVHDTSHGSEGTATVISRVSFDREFQKEYHIPIIIKDHGRDPFPLSATSTLTVVIGDINDNKMHSGSKTIFVYNYQGANYRNIPIGRVHVEDTDDWDLPDKSFHWQNGVRHPNFDLTENGTISMRNVSEGIYTLRFHVQDKAHTQDVSANVTVIVKNLPEEAVHKSGSIRISGITDEDFIRIWDWKSQRQVQSKYDQLRETLSKILKESTDNIDIFSVMTTYRKGVGPETDVRFAAHGSPYHKSTFLDGYVGLNIHAISQELGINITMVNIDECLSEAADKCDGSCYNTLRIAPYPYVVNANRTSFVGVHSKVIAECGCKARSYNEIEPEVGCKAYPSMCLNGGRCVMQGRIATCICPEGYDGPQCQLTSRTFSGDGSWAWFPPLEQCEDSHLSIEFMTETPNGLILYNGPIAAPMLGTQIVEDFISLELYQGRPKLIIDFGSGTSQIYLDAAREVNDGEWHSIDIFWSREEARMVIDHCETASFSPDETFRMDRSNCESTVQIEPYNQFLNLNAPLQLGGIYHNDSIADSFPGWKRTDRHTREHFKGCVRNLIHNSKMYDLGNAGGSLESTAPCQIAQERCQSDVVAKQCEHGQCEANYRSASCLCKPGYTGAKCDTLAPVKMFQSNSYMRYALSFDPNAYKTDIQMNFRTRQKMGELIRIPGKNSHQYLIIEIKDRRIRFRMQLDKGIIRTSDIELTLHDIIVNDGQWHTVRVSRFGSTASLILDGGGGKKYNETTEFKGYNQLFTVNKQGISIGGDVSYIGPGSYYVENGLSETCISDIRIDQRPLPLENGSENAAVTEYRNIDDGCHPPNQCQKNSVCASHLMCVDIWNQFECQCPTGQKSVLLKNDIVVCIDHNECIDKSCGNEGICHNLDEGRGFYCDCPYPENRICSNCTCDGQSTLYPLPSNITLGGHAVMAILICILISLLFVALFTLSRSNRLDQKFGPSDTDDDVRENIISYDDEGGGEDDMHAYDITPLRIPVDASGTPISTGGKQVLFNKPGILKDMRPRYPQEYHPTADLMDPKVRAINADDDLDPTSQPSDDLRNYAYEGCGSTAGSLSSLASIGEGEQDQNFDYLNRWGPRFQKLAYLYGPPETDDD